jgi:hypothetical protein
VTEAAAPESPRVVFTAPAPIHSAEATRSDSKPVFAVDHKRLEAKGWQQSPTPSFAAIPTRRAQK